MTQYNSKALPCSHLTGAGQRLAFLLFARVAVVGAGYGYGIIRAWEFLTATPDRVVTLYRRKNFPVRFVKQFRIIKTDITKYALDFLNTYDMLCRNDQSIKFRRCLYKNTKTLRKARRHEGN